jgi:hypothetical protein
LTLLFCGNRLWNSFLTAVNIFLNKLKQNLNSAIHNLTWNNTSKNSLKSSNSKQEEQINNLITRNNTNTGFTMDTPLKLMIHNLITRNSCSKHRYSMH